ncbi:uncharacterized protein LOC129001865 [Macrosteles quadrilineatus]|uniref:uncharacterized protein LOC129001865 n=1 Tax=Macrosteles quadrilineatus TaxID=74068 RepID=UPI0023E1D4C0|nr:uncharacterized protein LOC129001865 [Macrosteles quadrilineatus]
MAEELKKKLINCIEELPQKQGLLEELQQQCITLQLSKQELLSEIESLKMEVSNLQAQLDLTNKALHKCEEMFKEATESAVKHQLSLKVTTRCGEKMKEEAIRLHVRGVIGFMLYSQMRTLEKEYKDVERKSNETLSIGKKNNLVIENKDMTIKQCREKEHMLTAQITALSSEIKTLKLNESTNKPVEQTYVRDIMKEWQNSTNEMSMRIKNYERESEVLHQSLDTALKDMLKLQRFEEVANNKVRDLEARLQDVMNRDSKRCTDCSVQTDLTSAIDVGCQADKVEVSSTATQTDYVDQQIKDKDDSKAIPEKKTSISDLNIPVSSFSTTLSTPSFKYSSSSVSQLISRYQKEKARQESEEAELMLSQSQDISVLPTQLNLNLPK